MCQCEAQMTIVSVTASTRLRPLKAMRAFRVLQATGDTSQVFVILRAMRGKALINTFRRFAQSALGKKVLAERRDLLPALADREGLRRLRSEEHTSELQSHVNLVCRLLLEKKKK